MEQRDRLMAQIEQMAQALGTLLQRLCSLPATKTEKREFIEAIKQDWQKLTPFNPETTKMWNNDRFLEVLQNDTTLQAHLVTLGHLFYETALLEEGDDKKQLLQRTLFIYERATQQQTHYDISLHGRVEEVKKRLHP